jgi:uncharacterized protein
MKFVVSGLVLGLQENESDLKYKIAKEVRKEPSQFSYAILKKSVDARKGSVSFVYNVVVESSSYLTGRHVVPYEEPLPLQIPVSKLADRPVVVGFGPAGIFSALLLARAGAKPIVLERGKAVEGREKDIQNLRQNAIFNPESNVCYGEGGAGTFSDGKLNTGVSDPFIRFILSEFVKHGAKEDILTDSLPHIGSDYLKGIVKSFREEIRSLGGDILFESRFEGLLLQGGKTVGVTYSDPQGILRQLTTRHVILALGHSPHDTMKSLEKDGLLMTPKDFSIGVRIEHPQTEINAALYHEFAGNPKLSPASYRNVVHLPNGRSVYTFCMCPGGHVFNSSTQPATVLTNGMSDNARNAPNGNSALLVNVRVADYFKGHPLDGFDYREIIEKGAFLPSHPYCAPVETVGDLLAGRAPHSLGQVQPSYEPGVYLSDLRKAPLPAFIGEALLGALPALRGSMSFFGDPDAVLTGYETRSSSPIRIPRNENGEANLGGVYPAGEGASYAGGIMSAALDGLKIALLVLR